MTELLTFFSQFELELEEVSRLMKSIAAYPLSGEKREVGKLFDHTKVNGLELTERKRKTALQSVALSTGDPELFEKNFEEREIERAPDLASAEISAEVKRFPIHLQEAWDNIDRAKTISVIKELLGYAAQKLAGDVFTVFFVEGNQLNVTDLIQKVLTQFHENINQIDQGENIEGVKVYDQPITGRVTESVTRGYSLPIFLVINSKNDFDSGDCDRHINTSFMLAEEIKMLAESGDHVLVMGKGSNFGWVDRKCVGKDHDTAEAEVDQKQKSFYVDRQPFFFDANGDGNKTQRVLQPLDEIYIEGNTFFTRVADEKGGWRWQAIPGLKEEQVTKAFNFSTPADLQKALDVLFATRMPYTLPVNDCSSMVKKFFAMGGFMLERDSGGQMVGLRELFGKDNQREITRAEEMDELESGLYAVNQLVPNAHATYSSNHIYIVSIDNNHQMIAFSQGFDVQGDNGMEQPIGAHVCHRPALEAQLKKLRKVNEEDFYRKLVFTKLTI